MRFSLEGIWLTDKETNVQRKDRAEKHDQRKPSLRHVDSKKQDFSLKMLRFDFEKDAPYMGGEHVFRQIIKKGNRIVKNVVKMMLATSNIDHNGIAYIKISSK